MARRAAVGLPASTQPVQVRVDLAAGRIDTTSLVSLAREPPQQIPAVGGAEHSAALRAFSALLAYAGRWIPILFRNRTGQYHAMGEATILYALAEVGRSLRKLGQKFSKARVSGMFGHLGMDRWRQRALDLLAPGANAGLEVWTGPWVL